MCRKAAPYGGMQNGSYGEKEKNRENKAKDTMMETEETNCQEAFRQEVTRILRGKEGLPDEWYKTAEMLRKTAETVLGVRKKNGNEKETGRQEFFIFCKRSKSKYFL